MRIRKALSDLQLLHRSAAAASPSDQDNRWALPENDKNEEKMKQKGFEDNETWILEEKNKSANNDIRKIVSICEVEECSKKLLPPSSSSTQEGWCDGDDHYEVVPLKKRKGSFKRNPGEELISIGANTMKSKTNKKCGDIFNTVDDQKSEMVGAKNGNINSNSSMKKSKIRGSMIMEGSRCSRVNGRGWRCCQPTMVGYSLCEHHLGKGRLRSVANVRRDRGNDGGGVPPWLSGGDSSARQLLQPVMVRKKRTRVGVVKARSMSSLLSQI